MAFVHLLKSISMQKKSDFYFLSLAAPHFGRYLHGVALNNYFNSVFKTDNGDPLQEDCFFSDFDGDALSNISISPADVCLGLP